MVEEVAVSSGVPRLLLLSARADYILPCLVTQVRGLKRRRDFDEAPAAEHVKRKRLADGFGLLVVGSDAVRSKRVRSSRRNSLRVCLDAFLPFLGDCICIFAGFPFIVRGVSGWD